MINLIYIALAVVFTAVLTYMVTYNLRIKNRIKDLESRGRHPISTQEGIILATEPMEGTGRRKS